MAFKRSAVRSRLSPPNVEEVLLKPVSEKKRVFSITALIEALYRLNKLLNTKVQCNR